MLDTGFHIKTPETSSFDNYLQLSAHPYSQWYIWIRLLVGAPTG
jgi:hypothetical protein